jgi:hypothetical protein
MQSLDMPKPQEAPVSKFFAALISAAILASTFTSAAEAGPGRRFGFFLAGLGAGAMMHNDWEERRREEAYDRERARQMRADQQRAAAAAAAKRARLQALKQQQQQAAEQRQAAQIAAANANPPAPTADTSAPVLKKSDRLPSADDASAASDAPQATTIEKTVSSSVVSNTNGTADADTGAGCRKYSAAADSVIDTPCQ